MRRTLGVIAIGVACWGMSATAQAQDAKAVDQGRKLYATYKCDKCHTIAGRGTKKKNGELDSVGVKLTSTEIKTWLTKPADMEAKLDNPPKGTDSMANALKTKGIEPGEVDQLAAYLSTLKKK
jgi:mono/diheme cytochrome c family protein